MSPLEKVYKVLYNLGLNEEEAKYAIDTNIYLKKVIAADVIEVILFFEKYGLEAKEIAEIAKQNPWMLTENFERIKYLEGYYKLIGLEDYRELLIKQPIAMSVNPKEVKELIENFQKEGKTNEDIKNILLNNFRDYISL